MYIYPLKHSDRASLDIGGKAESLGKMIRQGLPVPDGYVITAQAFENGRLKKEAKKEFEDMLSSLSHMHNYAVRSSAVGEDGTEDSFAGAYETVLDVKVRNIEKALYTVVSSAEDERVDVYARERGTSSGGTAVIIQKYIPAQYAGVLFTADPMTANRGVMTGSFVKGAGEKLVSGDGMDGEFTIDAVRYSFKGSTELERYAKKLYRYALKISSDGVPKDIEWAVADGKVYILQSRPITTLHKNNRMLFDINDSLDGELLLSKTNVGEIFLRPVSPVTYSMLMKISDIIAIPLISAVCGQLYLNISGVCSMIMSFGVSKKRSFALIKEIAGGIPENIDIPVYRYDKKDLFRKILALIKGAGGSREYDVKKLKGNITEVSLKLIDEIRLAKTEKELSALWKEKCEPFMGGTAGVILSGLSVKSLFTTRDKLEKICGAELTDRLLSDCSENGDIESLGPLLAIEDIINGKMTREEYSKRYGHRHADEMELCMPYPYEDENFPDNVIEEYKSSGISAYKMKSEQEQRRQAAVSEFERKYPDKTGELKKLLKKYASAVYGRETIRSDALRLFCMIREYLKKAGELTGLNDDIFMLYIDEVMEYLDGRKLSAETIAKRRELYTKQLTMPNFPSMIYGRFTVDEWKGSGSPGGYYRFGETVESADKDVIVGIAGSVGQTEGIARVLKSIDEADSIEQGEILVVPAANIGWVRVFPKISAIVTDIGAPLSHAVIVARELGIPAAVSCQSASADLHTGDRIKVDGTLGRVYILDRA